MASRWRVAALALLLAAYLAAALLLSTVALHEPKGGRRPEAGAPPRPPEGARPRRSRPKWCRPLGYLAPPRARPFGLVSFPGSGNTWLRYLLQQATGYHTGSVYKDYGLLKNGFPAEAISNGSVLAVKTHEWGAPARQTFDRVVLLVRAPDAAIQAEFNRQSGGHVGFASPDRYRRTKGKYWHKFVAEKLGVWRQTNLDWIANFTGPVHVLFYDELVQDVETSLRHMLNFLEVDVDEELLQCALERREGIYRRKKRPMNFDPFTTNMRLMLAEEQERVYEAVKRYRQSANR